MRPNCGGLPAWSTLTSTPPRHSDCSGASVKKQSATILGPFPARPSSLIYSRMFARPRTLPTGFIPPCLPTKAETLPSGGAWLHEIKHDGFRIIARKDGERVRLYSRQGNDVTS